MWIAIEGIDGAGTTTQTRLLVDWLRKKSLVVHATREPSDGAVGRLIREMLLGRVSADARTMALMFAADRLDHVRSEIAKALQRGHVVTDRYLLSSLAYQSLDCETSWVQTINQFAPPADVTVLIDVPPELAEARRRAADRPQERFDDLALQKKIAQNYRQLAPLVGAVVLDGAQSVEQVHEQVVALISARLDAGSATAPR